MKLPKLEFKNLAFYGACGYAFLVPFSQKMATFGILIWVFLSIIQFKKERLNRNHFLLLLPILYLIYTVSFFLSQNQSIGFLEHKLSFIAFPLIFFLRKYDGLERKKVFNYFIFGLFAASIFCLVYAGYRSIQYVDGVWSFRPNLEQGRGFFESSIFGGNYFFGKDLSIFHQTVYFSIYLCTGITLLVFDWASIAKKYRLGLILFFTGIIFLISNKAGLLIIATVFLIWLFSLAISLRIKLLMLTTGLIVFGSIIFLNPRYKNSFNKMIKGEISIEKMARYDYKIRLLNWDAAIDLIKQEPLWGYGIGDSQNELNKKYKEKGYITPLKNSHNAHNQFLQTYIECGVIGFLWIVMIFWNMSRIAISLKDQRAFLIGIISILFLSLMFESIFSRFSGISFFSFLVCIVFFSKK